MSKQKSPKKIKPIAVVNGAFGNGPPERCVGIVERIDTPESGGIFTKYMGCNYLFKGYPDQKIVASVYSAKRIFSGISLLIKEKWIKFIMAFPILLFLLLPKKIKVKILIPLWDYFLNIAFLPMQPYILPENRYCKSVSELHRALGVLFKDIEDPVMLSRARRTRDVICMPLEYDYTYRARFQDFLSLLNKKKLKENPVKEINRLISILWKRENAIHLKLDGWIAASKVLLRYRQIRDLMLKLLLEIDLKKIKFDESDWYYVCDRDDYNYGGLSHDTRMKQKEKMDKEVGNQLLRIRFKNETKVA